MIKLLTKFETQSVSGGYSLRQLGKDLSNGADKFGQEIKNAGEAVGDFFSPEPEIKTVIKIVGTDTIYDELRKYDWVRCTNGMTRCTGGWNNGTSFDYNFQPK